MRTCSKSLRYAGLVSVALVLAACQGAADSEPVRPLRVVRIGHSDLLAMKKGISDMWSLCRISKGQHESAKPVQLLSDSYLERFPTEETEELFDGQHWASYQTVRNILPDHERDCLLTVYVERSVAIEHACRSFMSGRTTTIDEMLNMGKPPRHELYERQQPCGAKRSPADDVKGLPTEAAGSAQCVWESQILERVGSAAGFPTSEETYRGWDFCLYDRFTQYPFGDGRRSVVLKTRKLDINSMVGTPLPELLRAYTVFSTNPVSFSDGEPIPPHRFSRASMESFLRQPSKTPIEGAR
jgi:hypothetical protein